MNLGTRIFTWFNGSLVGTDNVGNRYYRDCRERPAHRERRWVLFQGRAEASQVPTGWYGWLHHMADAPPQSGSTPGLGWQQERLANPTGTQDAYGPPGHLSQGGRRDQVSGDYQPWRPS